jgi:trans-aconitate methyltransferase
MADGYDGRNLIDRLKGYRPAGSPVLELGMGPGTDLDMLRQSYEAVGSDTSILFLDRYRETQPDAALLQLDAVTLRTDLKFDAVYTSK